MSNNFTKQPNRLSYIKTFPPPASTSVNWIYKKILDTSVSLIPIQYITPQTPNSVFLPKDLVVKGSIFNVSDKRLKEKINDLTSSFCDNILKIIPKKYNFINDENKKEHYGIIAQDLEEIFPELVINTGINDNNVDSIKTINYLELIPIMIVKIQNMQKEIDELKKK